MSLRLPHKRAACEIGQELDLALRETQELLSEYNAACGLVADHLLESDGANRSTICMVLRILHVVQLLQTQLQTHVQLVGASVRDIAILSNNGVDIGAARSLLKAVPRQGEGPSCPS